MYFCTYGILLLKCCHYHLLLAQYLQIHTFAWSSQADALILEEEHVELGIVEFMDKHLGLKVTGFCYHI
jgi:hypothetical protein